MPLRKNALAMAAPDPLVLPEPDRPKMAVPSNASRSDHVSPGMGEKRTKGASITVTQGGGAAIMLFRRWVAKAIWVMSKDRTVRSEIRSLLQDAAKEMGFTVDSIRNEVVEKAWFGTELTPDVQNEWLREDLPQSDIEKAQDFKREDVYGQDPEIDEPRTVQHGLERSIEKEQDLEP